MKIQEKCAQYWNEYGVSDEEYHAALGWIARKADEQDAELTALRAENERLRARVDKLEKALETRGEIVRAAAGLASGPAREEILSLRARVAELEDDVAHWKRRADAEELMHGDDQC